MKDDVMYMSRPGTIDVLQVALNWCICKGTIPIPGAKSMSQAIETLGALNWRLDDGEVHSLDQAARRAPKAMLQNIFQTL